MCVTQTAEMYTFTALVTESTLVVRYDVFLCNGTLAQSLEKAMLQLSLDVTQKGKKWEMLGQKSVLQYGE